MDYAKCCGCVLPSVQCLETKDSVDDKLCSLRNLNFFCKSSPYTNSVGSNLTRYMLKLYLLR